MRFASSSLFRRMLLAALLALVPLVAATAGETAAPAAPAKTDEALWKKLVGTDEWGGIYMAGKKCGYLHTTLKLEKVDGKELLVYRVGMAFKMQYGGNPAEVRVAETHLFTPDAGAFISLERKIDTIMPNLPAPLAMRAKILPEGDGLRCTLSVGANKTESVIPKCDCSLESILSAQLLAIKPGAKPGDKLEAFMPVPESGKVLRGVSIYKEKKTITFRGVPTEVVEVEQALYESAPAGAAPEDAKKPPFAKMSAKIDTAGQALEVDLIGQFTFRLESEAEAKRLDAVSDVMLATGIALEKPIASARRAREVVLQVAGLPAGSAVSDDRQKYEDKGNGRHLLTLKRAEPPEKSAPLTEDEKKRLAEFLAPTAYLQSDDPKIRLKAAEIVGTETDPWKSSTLLCNWVYKNVKKVFTPAMSNATDTLATLKGDCGEHTALFVALCRASGVPAREAAGLAYTDSDGKPLFGGHAWAEVYAGGRWIAVDPTFGQPAADALHIKVAEGGFAGIEGIFRLADLMGKVKLEVVSAK